MRQAHRNESGIFILQIKSHNRTVNRFPAADKLLRIGRIYQLLRVGILQGIVRVDKRSSAYNKDK